MVGQQAWIAKFKADLDTCVKTMPGGVGKEERENILQWAKEYLNVKVRGAQYAVGICTEPLRQNDCDYFRRKAPEVVEDEDCAAQLEECTDFMRSELDLDFADFDYPPWNAMIKQLFPESDDGEEEVEEEESDSNTSKGKGRAAGLSKVGPPVPLTQTSSKAKPSAQTAGKAAVTQVPKARVTWSKSMTNIRAGEKPAPVVKPMVRFPVRIVGVLC